MHQYFKSNSGLGHKQYVYVLKLKEDRYLVCNSPYGSFYETGSIITDIEYMNFDKVTREEFLSNCNIHKDLINHLVQEGEKNDQSA